MMRRRAAPQVTLPEPRVFFAQIERSGHLARSDDADGPLGERIHGLHRARGVGFAFDPIEPRQKLLAVVEPVHGDAAGQGQICATFAVGTKCAVDRAQKAMPRVTREIDERGGRSVIRPVKLGHNRSQAGATA